MFAYSSFFWNGMIECFPISWRIIYSITFYFPWSLLSFGWAEWLLAFASSPRYAYLDYQPKQQVYLHFANNDFNNTPIRRIGPSYSSFSLDGVIPLFHWGSSWGNLSTPIFVFYYLAIAFINSTCFYHCYIDQFSSFLSTTRSATVVGYIVALMGSLIGLVICVG